MKNQLLLKLRFAILMFMMLSSALMIAQTTVTSFTEDFNSAIDLAAWTPNPITTDSTGTTDVFAVTHETDHLQVVMNQANFYDGQRYDITENYNVVLDLSNNGYFTVDLKVEPGAMYDTSTTETVSFLAGPWSHPNDSTWTRLTTPAAFNVPADGKWHTYTFDFEEMVGVPLFNGEIPSGDLSVVNSILLETVKWPNKYSATWSMDNFRLGDAAAPPTVVSHWSENFNAPINMELWNPNTTKHDDGSPVFNVAQNDGTLLVEMNQKNFYDGQHYDITKWTNKMIDMSQHGFMTVDIKVEMGAMYNGETADEVVFLASPWSRNEEGAAVRQVTPASFNVPADGEWHTYDFDFTSMIGVALFDGSIPPGDLSQIQLLLLETVKWPDKYNATWSIDNLVLGNSAGPDRMVTSYTEDFDNAVNLDLWTPNNRYTDSTKTTKVFNVTQSDDQINVDMHQKNFYDGQHYKIGQFEKITIDMVENGYMSVDIMVEPGATYNGEATDAVAFLASPWSHETDSTSTRQVTPAGYNVPADSNWYRLVFNFEEMIGVPLFDGSIPPGDLSAIKSILLETVKWPETYNAVWHMDNFKLGDAAAPPRLVRSYSEDFNRPVNMDLWASNDLKHDDGTPVFNVKQKNNLLKVDMIQKNFYDGQFYNISTHENLVIDMTEHGFFSIDLKVNPDAIYDSMAVDTVVFLASPWSIGATAVRQVTPAGFLVPADGDWHHYDFDFTSMIGVPLFDGTIPPGDLSRIAGILLETVKWPDKYDATWYMDNFQLGEVAGHPRVVDAYIEDFNDVVDLALWAPNDLTHDDGTPVFDVEQDEGQLNIDMSQKNFYDGQHYKITDSEHVIIDLSKHGFMTVDLMVETGAQYDSMDVDMVTFLASPWSVDTSGSVRQVTPPSVDVPADGEWHTVTFDFESQIGVPLFDGSIPPGDFSAIQSILLETVKWPNTYQAVWHMDNFKLGVPAGPPSVVYSYVQNFNHRDRVNLDQWAPNDLKHDDDDATPVFNVTWEGGRLDIDMQQKNFYDGQHYKITEFDNVVVDMVDNGLMSVWLMVEEGAEYDSTEVDTVVFLASPWSTDMAGDAVRQVTPASMDVPADGVWRKYTFDFTSQIGVPLFDGSIPDGDLSRISSILLETVKWPNTYSAKWHMDNFVLGAAVATPLVSKQVPAVAGKFWAAWNVNPTHNNMNGATGLAKGRVSGWGDYGVIVRFNPDGQVDARNGGSYEATTEFDYSANTNYLVEIIGDVETQTYSAYVYENGEKTTIADNFGFRANTSQDTLNFMAMKITESTDFDGIPGSSLRPSFRNKNYILGWTNKKGEALALSTEHTVSFDATPTANGINAAFALSSEEPGLLAWPDLSTIVRFNTAGFIDVRNGAAYEALEDYQYEAGQTYKVDMTLNVPTMTYSVNVTDEAGVVVTLATDYAFRKEATELNYTLTNDLIGGNHGGNEGSLVIENVNITTVGVNDIDAPNFNFYPNPTKDFIMVAADSRAKTIEVTSVSGTVLRSIETTGNSVEKVDISQLTAGSYIISVSNDKSVRSQIFVKK